MVCECTGVRQRLEHAPATGAPTVVRKYTWGLDLAGLMGAAGGVGVSPAFLEAAGTIGGLLAVDDLGRVGDRMAYFYDANGNVTEVVNLKDLGSGGTPDFTWDPARLLAHYEYDPYGNRTNAAPPGEYNQPWRFGTKQWDAYTGLSYFGYRYYSAGLGRWVNRDPIGEAGGPHLYVFSTNRAIGQFDALGLSVASEACGGEGWEPVDGGQHEINKIEYSPWVRVGENSMLDQLFRFRHLIKYQRLEYYWEQLTRSSELSACGKPLNFSVTIGFDRSESFDASLSIGFELFDVVDIGLAVGGSRGHSSSEATTYNFNEGEPCYQYRGFMFVQKARIQSGYLPPTRSPGIPSAMQYFGSYNTGYYTGLATKLLLTGAVNI